MLKPHAPNGGSRVTAAPMRFTVYSWGSIAFHAGTFEEVNARILEVHKRMKAACQFHIDFYVGYASRGEKIREP